MLDNSVVRDNTGVKKQLGTGRVGQPQTVVRFGVL